ncbi:hypothetical protein M9458_051362, partial [Cirrhinus mrigala]
PTCKICAQGPGGPPAPQPSGPSGLLRKETDLFSARSRTRSSAARPRLTSECAQSVLNFYSGSFQKASGAYDSRSRVTPLDLLHMRPLQRWLHDRVPRWAWHPGTLRIGVFPEYCRLFSPWSDPAFLRAGVPLGQGSRHVVLHADASATGWGAVCNGQAASGSWTEPRLLWHINCLEWLAVLLALRRFLPMLRHKHVLVRTDNTATVAYINRQGGLRSRRISQLARHLLLWSQTRLKSLRAVHIPGELNRAADQLSRQPTTLENGDSTPRHFITPSPRQGRTGTQLASGAQVRLSPSEPPCTDPVQDQGGRGAGSAGCAVLAHPDLVCRPHAPRDSPSLEDPLEEGPSFSGDGHNLAPTSRSVEPACDQVVNLQALPPEEADPASALLCPVRALRIYVDRTRSFRRSEQLFVCFEGQQKGNPVSKQRLAHWVVDAISLAYESQGEPCPLGVRAHSTWSVASSYALAHGASLADICRAAGWVTPNTFARFYDLRVEPVSSRVL